MSTLGRHGRWLEIFVSPCVDTAPGLAGVEPWVVRILDNFVFARPALKASQVDAQEPAKLRRGDYDLYRGGQPSKGGFRILAEMGVNIVVDLRGSRDSERKIVTHLGMQYVALSWQCSFPKDKTFAQFLPLLRKNRGKKIFVHCRLGDDRTAMMIASYRIAEEGWSAEKAEKEMEKFGFSFTHRRLICPACLPMKSTFLSDLKPARISGPALGGQI